jgi:hypothetical protein
MLVLTAPEDSSLFCQDNSLELAGDHLPIVLAVSRPGDLFKLLLTCIVLVTTLSPVALAPDALVFTHKHAVIMSDMYTFGQD